MEQREICEESFSLTGYRRNQPCGFWSIRLQSQLEILNFSLSKTKSTFYYVDINYISKEFLEVNAVPNVYSKM